MLVLAAVTAVIASSFLFRSVQEAKLATRSTFQAVALHLAEAGIEEGLYAANTRAFTTANGWSLASGSTTTYVKSITSGFNFQQATGAIYIRVENTHTVSPIVIAAGAINIPNQRGFVKQIRIGTTKRKLWSNSLVSKSTVTFSGNTLIDSFDSTLGAYNAITNRSDQATVASASTALDAVVIGSNSSIYGYVATTGDDPVVGIGGRIYGATTPVGVTVDSSRIRRDFTANLPDVSAPTTAATSLSAISSSLTLPRSGDPVGTNGRYLYTTPSIGLAGTDVLTLTANVDVIVTGSVAVAGNAYFSIGASGSMGLYVAGNVALAGNGLVNNSPTAGNATIWGTVATGGTQTVSLAGNGAFIGTVYAPNANLSMTGNGAVSGAVIANQITIGGNGNFHYDVKLGTLETSVDTSFRVTAWSELNAAPGSGAAFARISSEPFAGLF